MTTPHLGQDAAFERAREAEPERWTLQYEAQPDGSRVLVRATEQPGHIHVKVQEDGVWPWKWAN